MTTPPGGGRDGAREAEAEAVLDRVRRETDTVGGSALARMAQRTGDHFAGRDGTSDPVEVWGRRIGRALSVVLAIGLTWLLGRQLGWW